MKKTKKEGGKDKSSNKTWNRKIVDAKKFMKKELNMLVKKASDKVYKKAKKELNSLAKRKKSNDDDDDDKSVESLNVVDNQLVANKAKIEKINREMNNVDAQLKKFDFLRLVREFNSFFTFL